MEHRQCAATVRINGHEGRRCKRAARAGRLTCASHHYPERDGRAFYISKSYKPHPRTARGGYRKCVIGRLFPTRGAAELWMRCHWHEIAKDAPGRRFVSATVERMSAHCRLEV